MNVKVYDMASDGTKTLRGISTLADCFPARDAAYHVALVQLKQMGHCYYGGGATPAVFITTA